MRFTLLLLLVSILVSARQDHPSDASLIFESALRTGDIIFQTSTSDQSLAIRLATASAYSHCGMIFRDANGLQVFEAVQPVKSTPLNEWIARGAGSHYVVKRLRNADAAFTPAALAALDSMRTAAKGKDYDLAFDWDDEQYYCSELVWKLLQRSTGEEVGKTQLLGEFDLSHPLVKFKLKERFGEEVPLGETVISPGNIFDSELLETVLQK